MSRILILCLMCAGLIACGGPQASKPTAEPERQTSPQANAENAGSEAVKSVESKPSGGYYLDDGPEPNPPSNLDEIPDAVPMHEPLDPNKNKPYQALGETYTPIKSNKFFKQSGIASWYGKRFHGKKTANGEKYDMYAMTAAHPTLPLPSYVKVVNPTNNRSVIVRVNDRGPFKHKRIIDLSYAAAHKLRIVERGSAPVHIETVDVDAYHAENNSRRHEPIDHGNVPPDTLNVANPIKQFFVQVGAFKLEENARNLKQKIQNLGIAHQTNINHVYNNQLHRLKLGPYRHQDQARQIADELRKKLNIASIIKHQ